jgi:AcrR family transcriptional regulator
VARTVDPERHQQRRLVIIDAALTCFARDGYERTTTAAICRQAGIGSGTLFHYFPTKLAILTGVLEYGTGETREWFAAHDQDVDPWQVVLGWVDQCARDATDERLAGFVVAVGGVMTVPEVASALADDERAQREGLRPWVERARAEGAIRGDWSVDRSLQWILLLLNGFLDRIASEPGFRAADEAAHLRDAVTRVLAAEQRGPAPR